MANMRIKALLLLMLLTYNITTAKNVSENENPIRTNTNSENFQTNDYTSETVTITENQENTPRNFQKNVSARRSKVLSFSDTNAINKSIHSVPSGNITRMVDIHEKSSKSSRKSKILPFASGAQAVSNSLLETDGGLGSFVDLDLDMLSIENLHTLNTATKLSDYASLFGLDIFEEDGTFTTDVGSGGQLRTDRILHSYNSENDIVSGEPASCQPELQTVVLNEDLGSKYYPGCVRLRRCGGCCMSDLLECRPTKTEPVKIKVVKVDQYSSKTTSLSQSTGRNNRGHGRGHGRGRRSRGRPQPRNSAKLDIVHEWQHTSCACQCRMQAHHCHPVLEDYSPNECACVCKNRDEERLCYSQSSNHFWDKKSCSCKCRRTKECSTGEIFDHQSCRCSMPLKDVNT